MIAFGQITMVICLIGTRSSEKKIQFEKENLFRSFDIVYLKFIFIRCTMMIGHTKKFRHEEGCMNEQQCCLVTSKFPKGESGNEEHLLHESIRFGFVKQKS